MIRRLAAVALLFALPAAMHSQTFKTDKFDIQGMGGFDYLSVDNTTGRVFVSRGNHVMVVDGMTGKVAGDVPLPSSAHGAQIVQKFNRGFTTNGGRDSSSVTVFDLKTLAVISTTTVHVGGLDGFGFDDATDRVFTSNHSGTGGAPGSATAIDPRTGAVIGSVTLAGVPEGVVGDGKGQMFINLEDKASLQLFDAKTLTAGAVWPTCDSPTGLAIDRPNNRLFVGCSKMSAVVDSKTGKVVAQFPVGQGVDALGWDASQKLIYVPAGDGTVTVVHQDSPDKYTVVATVQTMRGARTIVVDDKTHRAYVFTPEYGPAPAPAAGAPPPTGRGGPRGPMIGAWLIAISH